jgi:hypothetical protein
LNEPEQDRDWDGSVPNEKKPGENARAKCQLRRQLFVIQTEGLKETGSAVGEMKSKQKQADDVKE